MIALLLMLLSAETEAKQIGGPVKMYFYAKEDASADMIICKKIEGGYHCISTERLQDAPSEPEKPDVTPKDIHRL